MKKKKHNSLLKLSEAEIAGGLIALSFVALVALYAPLVKYWQIRQELSTPTADVMLSANEPRPESYGTYRSKYGFEFKYPYNWSLSEIVVDDYKLVSITLSKPPISEIKEAANQVQVAFQATNSDLKSWRASFSKNLKIKSSTDVSLGNIKPDKLLGYEELSGRKLKYEGFAMDTSVGNFYVQYDVSPDSKSVYSDSRKHAAGIILSTLKVTQ